ncbi:MAG: universal stress protein [Halobacteriales archaeon]
MGTIFVAYGEPGDREAVLRLAAEQAGAAGHDLLVYHVQEPESAPADVLRAEVDAVVADVAPDLEATVRVDPRDPVTDETNVSPAKRLVDAVLEEADDLEYVVMGDVERGSIDGLVHASMTEAVLDTHAVPVLLVPV